MPQMSFPANVVVAAPPFCTAGRPPAPHGLPKFVFVAGVEGSGHHALKDVWHSLKEHGTSLELIVYDQLFHSLGIENHASYHYSSIRLETYRKNMAPVFAKAQQAGITMVIDAQNSYPMGMGAGSLAHPDLLALQQLDGELFDLRVIVLYRDPVSATLSAVRRFRDNAVYSYKNYNYQARLISESLMTLNNALPALSCGHYMMIQYKELVAAPLNFIGPIGELLEVPEKHLQNSFLGVKLPAPRVDSSGVAAQRASLTTFFDQYARLWPFLSGLPAQDQ